MPGKKKTKPPVRRDLLDALRRRDPRFVVPSQGRPPKYAYRALGWSGMLLTKAGLLRILEDDMDWRSSDDDSYQRFEWMKVRLWKGEDE